MLLKHIHLFFILKITHLLNQNKIKLIFLYPYKNSREKYFLTEQLAKKRFFSYLFASYSDSSLQQLRIQFPYLYETRHLLFFFQISLILGANWEKKNSNIGLNFDGLGKNNSKFQKSLSLKEPYMKFKEKNYNWNVSIIKIHTACIFMYADTCIMGINKQTLIIQLS